MFDEKEYKRLLGEPAETCCEWLVEQNRYILIRDEHWDKVFTNIENDINYFGRYYSLLRVKMDGHFEKNCGGRLRTMPKGVGCVRLPFLCKNEIMLTPRLIKMAGNFPALDGPGSCDQPK